jgi:hypothetical protein
LCYEIRDQATIIASALFTAITTIYGGIAFYGRFTLGRQRLSALGVDLKHLKKVVEVFATAFLIDKVIRLHKRKDEITVKTLWRDIPFDQDMDRDVVAELQTQVDNLTRFIREHVQSGDAIVQLQSGGSSANDNHSSHSVGAPSSSAVLAPGSSEQTTICPPLNEVVVHESRNAPLQAPREGYTRSPSPRAHSSNSTPSLSCAILKLITYHRDSFFAALNDSAAVAAGSSNAQVSTKLGRTIVPAFAPGRRGVQPTTQKVLALQPLMPPAPPRSRSKSRVRAADDALSTSGVDPVQAASASAADARAPLDPAAQPSHGAAAASAGGGTSRHSERRSAEKQPSRKSRGNGPPSLAAALEKARLDQIDWC